MAEARPSVAASANEWAYIPHPLLRSPLEPRQAPKCVPTLAAAIATSPVKYAAVRSRVALGTRGAAVAKEETAKVWRSTDACELAPAVMRSLYSSARSVALLASTLATARRARSPCARAVQIHETLPIDLDSSVRRATVVKPWDVAIVQRPAVRTPDYEAHHRVYNASNLRAGTPMLADIFEDVRSRSGSREATRRPTSAGLTAGATSSARRVEATAHLGPGAYGVAEPPHAGRIPGPACSQTPRFQEKEVDEQARARPLGLYAMPATKRTQRYAHTPTLQSPVARFQPIPGASVGVDTVNVASEAALPAEGAAIPVHARTYQHVFETTLPRLGAAFSGVTERPPGSGSREMAVAVRAAKHHTLEEALRDRRNLRSATSIRSKVMRSVAGAGSAGSNDALGPGTYLDGVLRAEASVRPRSAGSAVVPFSHGDRFTARVPAYKTLSHGTIVDDTVLGHRQRDASKSKRVALGVGSGHEWFANDAAKTDAPDIVYRCDVAGSPVASMSVIMAARASKRRGSSPDVSTATASVPREAAHRASRSGGRPITPSLRRPTTASHMLTPGGSEPHLAPTAAAPCNQPVGRETLFTHVYDTGRLVDAERKLGAIDALQMTVNGRAATVKVVAPNKPSFFMASSSASGRSLPVSTYVQHTQQVREQAFQRAVAKRDERRIRAAAKAKRSADAGEDGGSPRDDAGLRSTSSQQLRGSSNHPDIAPLAVDVHASAHSSFAGARTPGSTMRGQSPPPFFASVNPGSPVAGGSVGSPRAQRSMTPSSAHSTAIRLASPSGPRVPQGDTFFAS